ncbi:MAG: hypothetical protein R3220_05270, partial [Balneolaceae bacterium]|nr:hypothetical protein [Balneolaceae bacterium]
MAEKKKLHILNLEPEGYSPMARQILEDFGHVDDGPLDRTSLIREVDKYHVLIVRLGHMIDAEIIEAAKNLKYIVTATTGLNHIDFKKAQEHGITVLSLKGERDFLDRVYATAEHTWALLLALIRKVPQAHQHVLNGGWNRDLFRGY